MLTCPNCGAIAQYDQYYGRIACTRCGWESEKISREEAEKPKANSFRKEEFLAYLTEQFPAMATHFCYDLVARLIDYGLMAHNSSGGQFAHWLADMLPEATAAEVHAYVV